MPKQTMATPGLGDNDAVRLVARLIEEQVVTLDNALERLQGKAPTTAEPVERATAGAAATASMMSLSLAINHVLSRIDALTPQLLNVINNGLYQYVQKLLQLLPYINAQGISVTLTTSIPPVATLALSIQP
ncbi:MAG: hypothetical protein NTZ05_21600 [Chloroflexi bacterium]|nr:hypothetical protein [Chloroflexota bacterium]